MELTATGVVQRPWQPVAGFTWELFLIGSAWVIAFAMIPFILFWMKRGASPSTLFWLAFWGYVGLTYKVTSWLSDKYREDSILIEPDTGHFELEKPDVVSKHIEAMLATIEVPAAAT